MVVESMIGEYHTSQDPSAALNCLRKVVSFNPLNAEWSVYTTTL